MRKQHSVLLDRTFVQALLAEDDPAHGSAKRIYAGLVTRYEDGDDLLFAASTVLRDLPTEFRRGSLAPVANLWVARQHRTAARRVAGAVTPDVAIDLVLLQREHIRTVATASTAFDGYELTVLRATPDDPETDPAEPHPDGYVMFRTEPLPAQRSTGE